MYASRGLVVLSAVILTSSLGASLVSVGVSHPAVPHATNSSSSVSEALASPSSGVAAPNVISPHPHRLVVHEVAPAGAVTMDPAVAYDVISYEPIANVYETLVAYNGSSTGSFVPVLSTCVPGDAACGLDYNLSGVAGTDLIAAATSGPLAGQPVFFTFPIDPAAKFYDPSTAASWPVYPSDVVFSITRTLNFADVPFVGAQNGWMLAQALVPPGNSSYDSGRHAPYNTTPYHILSSMLVNNTTYCPAAALAQAGCVTFVADGSGEDWPFLLDLLANGLGASVTPCGVFTANGVSVPGFTVAGAPPNGDGSCLLPGGTNSTSDPAFQSYLSSVSDTSWDSAQEPPLLPPGGGDYAAWNLTGSGPYWGAVALTKGYTLRANPAYAQPSGCSGALHYRYTGYCDPAPGQYLPQVNVSYDPNDSASVTGFETGSIDAGVLFPTQNQPLPPGLTGKFQLSLAHTLTNIAFAFNLRWNLTAYQQAYSGPAPTIPTDFFASPAARQFFTEAFPYLMISNQLLNTWGIPYSFQACGPIPFGMGDYYPLNLTCPGGNPDTNPADVGGAAWWWSEGRNPVSPYYDPELAACTPSAPCVFPIESLLGMTSLNAAEQLWVSSVESLTSDAVMPYLLNPSNTLHAASQLPIWVSGWAASYPDPSDPTSAYLLPSGAFAPQSSVALVLNETNTSANRSACGHAGGAPADLAYWAYNVSIYAPGCQGIAYDAAVEAAQQARPLPDSPARVFLYNEMMQIATKLGLYTWFDQENSVDFLVPWIDVSSVNSNPTLGGGGDQPFFHWAERPPNTATFVAQKLPVGAVWGVTLDGVTRNNTTVPAGAVSTGSLTILVPNGSFPLNISSPHGYGVTRISGPGGPNQTGLSVTGDVRVVYRISFGQLEAVTFYQNLTRAHGTSHMYTGAPWQVYLNSSWARGGDPVSHLLTGTNFSLGPVLLPQGGRYTFQVTGFPSIYRVAPGHGGFAVPAQPFYRPIAFHLLTAPVKFSESGLKSPFTWNITLVNASGPGAAWFAADCGGAGCVFAKTNGSAVVAHLPAGVYGWVAATDVAGENATPSSGIVTVIVPASGTVLVTITWSG